jgi:hypothetical protein
MEVFALVCYVRYHKAVKVVKTKNKLCLLQFFFSGPLNAIVASCFVVFFSLTLESTSPISLFCSTFTVNERPCKVLLQSLNRTLLLQTPRDAENM